MYLQSGLQGEYQRRHAFCRHFKDQLISRILYHNFCVFFVGSKIDIFIVNSTFCGKEMRNKNSSNFNMYKKNCGFSSYKTLILYILGIDERNSYAAFATCS